MTDRVIERLAELAVEHSKLISAVSLVWMALTAANYARFIVLPKIPFLAEPVVMWLSIGLNAGWWAILYPRIEKLRQQRSDADADASSA